MGNKSSKDAPTKKEENKTVSPEKTQRQRERDDRLKKWKADVAAMRARMEKERSIQAQIEWKAEVLRVFQSLDVNNDGEVSLSEMFKVYGDKPILGVSAYLIKRQLDTNGDDKVSWIEFYNGFKQFTPRTKAEVKAEVQSFFTMADTDKSGALKFAELWDVFERQKYRLPGMEGKTAKDILTEFDIDNDQSLTFEEFWAGVHTMIYGKQAEYHRRQWKGHCKSVFDAIDANSDGYITYEEMFRAYGNSPILGVDSFFIRKYFDTDFDSRISWAEFWTEFAKYPPKTKSQLKKELRLFFDRVDSCRSGDDHQDGVLSFRELWIAIDAFGYRIPGLEGYNAQQVFKLLDVNGDATVTWEEFWKAIEGKVYTGPPKSSDESKSSGGVVDTGDEKE